MIKKHQRIIQDFKSGHPKKTYGSYKFKVKPYKHGDSVLILYYKKQQEVNKAMKELESDGFNDDFLWSGKALGYRTIQIYSDLMM